MSDTNSQSKAAKKVVGISYTDGDPAPLVMLKAAGDEAETLLRQAEQREEIPVVRDAALVNQLYRIPMDQPVGRELFPVMALLLAHVLQVDQKRTEANT